jgi:cysteine synthase
MLGMLLVPAASGVAGTSATVLVKQCTANPLVECGSIVVPLYRSHPGAGPPITVHFRIYRHRDQSAPAGEPVVAFEGGPGYPSIGSAATYLFMLGSLHRTHDLIVMDQRGTGTSDPIRCLDLQNGIGNYVQATAACAGRLGVAANAFGTAAVADDMAAILRGLGIHKVDVYGDSYGTYAAQVFTANHPQLVRAAVLDGTFDNSFNPFEPEESASLRHAWTAICRRAGSCHGILRSIGTFDRRLAAHPLVGRGKDADGYMEHVHLTPTGFTQLVVDATYTYTIFRDLPGALHAFSHGDRAPMLRLAAEDVSLNAAGGNAAGYSVGDLEAVSCHDYPSIWNIAASVPERRAQLNRAIAALPAGVFAPFSNRVWLAAQDESELVRGCLEWPAPKFPDPPFPAGPHPHIPVLVLDGEFDQATPVADARMAAAAWPDSTYVQFANTGHISALDDYQRCASGIVRAFLTVLEAGDTACAARIPAINAVQFPAGSRPGRQPCAGGRPAGRLGGQRHGGRCPVALVQPHVRSGGPRPARRPVHRPWAVRVVCPPARDQVPRRPVRAGPGGVRLGHLEPRGAACAGHTHAARPGRRVRGDHSELPDQPAPRAGDGDRHPRRASGAPASVGPVDVGGVTGMSVETHRTAPPLSSSVVEAIGGTPMLAIEGIYAKLEYLNPSGSIKARLARYMIERAEDEGLLRPGDSIVEASSGNTGNAMSMVAAAKGYRMLVVMPEGMSPERIAISRAHGADILLVGDFHVNGALEHARTLGERPGYFHPGQFDSEWNVTENREWLGAEILEQLPARPDALVAGVGTGGTLIGVGQAFRAVNPEVLVVALEPGESRTICCGEIALHSIEGIADGFVPGIVQRHRSEISDVVSVSSPEALTEMRRLAREHGIFVGPSSGAHMLAAQRLRRERPDLAVIVTLFCDEGEKYIADHHGPG